MQPDELRLFRLYDYTASISIGILAAITPALILPATLHHAIAMFLGMFIGMLVQIPVLVAFIRVSTSFDILMPGMIIGMVAGMISAMKGDGEIPFASLAITGVIIAVVVQFVFHIYDAKLHGELTRPESDDQR